MDGRAGYSLGLATGVNKIVYPLAVAFILLWPWAWGHTHAVNNNMIITFVFDNNILMEWDPPIRARIVVFSS